MVRRPTTTLSRQTVSLSGSLTTQEPTSQTNSWFSARLCQGIPRRRAPQRHSRVFSTSNPTCLPLHALETVLLDTGASRRLRHPAPGQVGASATLGLPYRANPLCSICMDRENVIPMDGNNHRASFHDALRDAAAWSGPQPRAPFVACSRRGASYGPFINAEWAVMDASSRQLRIGDD